MRARPRGWPRPFALALAFLLASSFLACAGSRHEGPRSDAASVTLVGRPLPALRAASWSDHAALDSIAGHATVVAFVSFDLPGSLRVLPALEAWNDAYARYGVRVLAVHVPAFAFAADSAHSATAARRLGLRFPIGLDSAFEVWRAFGPEARTPRVLVAGRDGRVVMDQERAAAIPEAERWIRDLVQRTHPRVRFPRAAVASAVDPEAQEHPAVHLGRARVESGPLRAAETGRVANFTAQLRYQVEGDLYTPYPVGRWIPAADGLTAARGGAENFVALRYDAGALGAVLGPAETGPVRVWVLRDDRWLAREDAGADVQFDGRGASFVMVTEPRLYALTRESKGGHVAKLSPDQPGATIYALTFVPFGDDEKP